MNASGKGLFVLLVVFLLLSAGLGYAGIARLHRMHYPPFNDGLYATMDKIPHPSPEAIQFLDSRGGRILAGSLAVIIPVACVLLVFVRDYRIAGFSLLIVATAGYGLAGVSLFLHGVFDAPISLLPGG